LNVNNIVKLFKRLENYVWGKDVIPVKASTLANFFWCSRKSYITFILENAPPNIEDELGLDFNLLTTGDIEAARIGQLIHGVRYGFYVEVLPIPSKNDVYRLAKEGHVIPRNLETRVGSFQVQGAVDEIWFEDGGYVIRELKTTKSKSISLYMLKPAEFQTQIYGWILSNYLPIKRLELVFINQVSRKVIHSCIVSFNEEDVKNRIIDVLEKYRSKQLKPPKSWKCSKCSLRLLCEKVLESR